MDQQKAERESMSPPASPHCKYDYIIQLIHTITHTVNDIDTKVLVLNKLY